MASSLKVNRIVPSTGTNIGFGTANGQIRLASTSKLTFDGDTDTYIHHPSANQLAITRGGASYPIIRFGSGGGGNTITMGNTTSNLVTNGEILSVRGYSSFKSVNKDYAAIYTHNEGNTSGTYNAHILWNANGANRGGIGYMPNTGDVIINNQNALIFATGATHLGGTERIRIKNDGKIGIGTNNPSQKVSIASGRVSIDVNNDYYGVWMDGNTTGENHISVGRWYNTGGGLKSGYSQYGVNNLVLENNHPTASHTLIIQPLGQKVAIGTHVHSDDHLVNIKGDINVTGSIKSNNLPGRNIIVNGAMQVAQRKPSGEYTGQAVYATVDRMRGQYSVPNTDPVTECHVLTSSDTGPWEKGFRKSYRMKIGYQGGTAAGYYYQFQYRIEGQDIANSGWDYTSSSSYITLSFWVKSSVAYNPSWFIRSKHGTEKIYRFQPGTLTANTWKKVTQTIPGNSGITMNDDNTHGLQVNLSPYWGANYSSADPSMETWENFVSGTRAKDTVATWFETNGSTMEITGLQLEVGSIATEFEHLPYAEHLRRCQRYFYRVQGDSGDRVGIGGCCVNALEARMNVTFPVTLRALPAISGSGTAQFDAENDSADFNCSSLTIDSTPTGLVSGIGLQISSSGMTGRQSGGIRFRVNSSTISFSAEL